MKLIKYYYKKKDEKFFLYVVPSVKLAEDIYTRAKSFWEKDECLKGFVKNIKTIE